MSTSNTNNKHTSTLKEKLTQNQHLINPCLREYNISWKCLEDNKYETNNCTMQFENYKLCKKFWKEVVFNRKVQDIKPYLPLPEEREQIKEEYLQSRKK
ncbi:coiled-coil-helix-coiled-coil-helix domain-containing protein 7 [Bombus pascuorum]|uniref:coiled-coil-helix-coiled-coil-helix domain-containing protein 7 n=1 Tax=Bombus pascuorum TaxID=65598 RepID=UPI00298ECD43|nr:coiled-coil-helix-coiled-coil-helix domain-containing protein 7 [Bombus pascuorum]